MQLRRLHLLLATICLSCSEPNTSDEMRGVEGGPCFADGTCNTGLICIEAICRGEMRVRDADIEAGVETPDAESLDAEPSDAEPLDAESIDAEQLDTESMDAEPSDAESIDAERFDAESTDVEDAGRDAGQLPPSEGTFRITGLHTTSCQSDSLTNLQSFGGARGSDPGILAFTPDRVFLREYDAPWDQLDVGRRHLLDGRDALVTDIGTATLYVFGSGGVAMDFDSGPSVMVDELIALDDVGELTTDLVPLSSPIVISRGDVSFFSGVGRVVVVTAGRIFDVQIPSGTVTDLGPLADVPDAEPCYDLRYRSNGVVELFDGELHLVYKTSSTAISRYSVTTATTSVVSTFADIQWDCPFSFAPLYQRWLLAYARPLDNRVHGMLTHCDGTFDTPGNPPAPVLTGATPPFSISQTAVQVQGTAEPGALVELYDSRTCRGSPLASGTVDVAGNFSVQVSAPANTRTNFFGHAVRSDGTQSLCAIGPSFVHDNIRPTFGGATAAQAFGTTVSIHWALGADNLTPQDELVYDVCMSTTSGACSTFSVFATSAPGSTRAVLRGLTPGQTYYFVARIRDWAGTRDLNTVEVSAVAVAQPSRTFRLDSLSTSSCETSDEVPWTMEETVASSSAAFSMGGDQTVPYELEDLRGGSLVNGYGLGYHDLVSDLLTEKVYALQNGTTDFGYPLSVVPAQTEVVDNLVELDSLTLAKTSRRIYLSSPIQLFAGAYIFSGFGRLIIFDGERLVNVDLPGGEVTHLGSGRWLDITRCYVNYFGAGIGHGLVEDVGGALSFIFIDSRHQIARYDLASNTQAPIPGAPTPTGCSIGFSPSYSRWYYTTNAQQNSTLTHCDAVYSQPAGNPFDAGFAPGTDGGTSVGPACTNGSTNDCNPIASTFAPFVDPSPPAGYRQCAGFTNGADLDIESNWLDNCYPDRAGPLWIRLFDSTTGALISGARLTRTACPGYFYAPDLQEGIGFTDPTVSCQQAGVSIDWSYPPGFRCNSEDFPFKIDAYRTNGTEVLIGAAPQSPQNEAIMLPTFGGCSVQTRALRVAIYVPN
jgi:hypothetical protein